MNSEMKMKKNILNALLLAALLSACGKDDVILYMPGTETPIEVPSRIEITITSPESDTDSDADVPTDGLNVYLIPASGDTSGDGDDTDVPSATFTTDTLVHVEADTYTCLVTNAPTDDTTLTGTVLTLEDSDQDGFYDSCGQAALCWTWRHTGSRRRRLLFLPTHVPFV